MFFLMNRINRNISEELSWLMVFLILELHQVKRKTTAMFERKEKDLVSSIWPKRVIHKL